MDHTPIIGVSGYRDEGEHLITNYTDAVFKAGGIPVIIPIMTNEAMIETVTDRLDGLLMTGGVDFDPLFSCGEEPVPEVGGTDPRRDEFDIKLVRAAVAKGIPVFGICRGHQLMSVAFGGSLWQDFASQKGGQFLKHRQTGTPATFGTHTIAIEEGSFLEKALGTNKAIVNSLHHQAIRNMPHGFRVVASSPDGIIEAIERVEPLEGFQDGGGQIFSVQFHPEILVRGNDKSCEALFRLLVVAASTK